MSEQKYLLIDYVKKERKQVVKKVFYAKKDRNQFLTSNTLYFLIPTSPLCIAQQQPR